MCDMRSNPALPHRGNESIYVVAGIGAQSGGLDSIRALAVEHLQRTVPLRSTIRLSDDDVRTESVPVFHQHMRREAELCGLSRALPRQLRFRVRGSDFLDAAARASASRSNKGRSKMPVWSLTRQ